MTAIAFDGRTLAADKMATDHRGRPMTVTKIHKAHDGRLLAAAGESSVCAELVDWYQNGAAPENFPNQARARESELLVFGGEVILQFCCSPVPCKIEDRQHVCGSGGELARGVLHMGGNAVQAVEAACLWRGDCGNGVDVLEL